MVSIKKQEIKAYILLESILAMALLAVLSGFVITEISASRAQVAKQNQAIEVLNVGLMAFDSKQSHLLENGVDVTLIQTAQEVVLESSGQEVLRLEILQETPQSLYLTGMSGGTLIDEFVHACDSRHDGLDHARI